VAARFNWQSRPLVGHPGTAGTVGAAPAGAGASQNPAADAAQEPHSASHARRVLPPSGLQYLQTGDAHIEAVVQKLRRIMNRDIPLLILGETGTGKELLARALHQDSIRSRQPFVAVNCASIPEALIEAELFGYEEGAFTGAKRKGATGRLVQANAGTLFLDEIGDMPLGLQARLLRVLQERCVTPLGSHKSIPVDIALIGATHRNMREMIERHEFREDLYYRLNGLVVRLPALRERTDLGMVARRILQAECPVNTPEISPTVMDLFRRYGWPGNIRQLANVLRTAAVMAIGERQITEGHLSDDFLEDVRRIAPPVHPMAARLAAAEGSVSFYAAAPAGAAAVGSAALASFGGAATGAAILPGAASGAVAEAATETKPEKPAAVTLEQAEIEMMQNALAAAGGNISEAAKRLGISRNTIYRKLRWNKGS
jgi:sigma-54 dependent transcriptional regulator, acetoin dehydrogenase operon transcriptional activator AcoR